jgi:hypothetical protein
VRGGSLLAFDTKQEITRKKKNKQIAESSFRDLRMLFISTLIV